MGLSESEVGPEEAGTLAERPLGLNRGNTLAVQLQLASVGASRDQATTEDVRVLADGTNAALHVASTRRANDPGDVNAASGDVACCKAGVEGVGLSNTVLNYQRCKPMTFNI
jgi:hypothetical protein